jgi:excinuclease UvrABC nuclease subunit
MSSAKKRLQEIRKKEVKNTGKRVCLVEGEDDVGAYNEILNRRFSFSWEDEWIITHAGNKQKVIDIIAAEPMMGFAIALPILRLLV